VVAWFVHAVVAAVLFTKERGPEFVKHTDLTLKFYKIALGFVLAMQILGLLLVIAGVSVTIGLGSVFLGHLSGLSLAWAYLSLMAAYVIILPVPVIAFAVVSRIMRNLKPDRSAFRSAYLSAEEVSGKETQLSFLITTELLAVVSTAPMFFVLITFFIFCQQVAITLVALVLSWFLMPIFVSQVALSISIASRRGRVEPSYPRLHAIITGFGGATIIGFDLLVIAMSFTSTLLNFLTVGQYVAGAIAVLSFEVFVLSHLWSQFRRLWKPSQETIVWQFELIESIATPKNTPLPSISELDGFDQV
jgi:hypothetical protein